jgi:hypothetical protein
MNNEEIKAFVQKTLGCGCPEEVFQYMDLKSDIKVDDIMLKGRINIGNRLLIYIVEMDDIDSIKHVVTFFTGMGIKERDGSNFNRFRLVLASDNCDGIRQAAEAVFRDIDKDEKVHLHIIPAKNIPQF